jgi:L-histidine N-alpha-methyltransferase
VDISPSYLALVVADIGAAFPEITVLPSQSDITVLDLPATLETPIVYAFLGSTIGNFDEAAAVQLLTRVRAAMRPDDRFLLGVDLLKDSATLERAYNDAQGVTAEFNLNVLRVLNHRLGTDFDLAAFQHHAFFNQRESRIEMHLVSSVPQRVYVPRRGSISLEQGETIRTEISCKYDHSSVASLFRQSGLALEHWTVDARGWFALVVGRTD